MVQTSSRADNARELVLITLSADNAPVALAGAAAATNAIFTREYNALREELLTAPPGGAPVDFDTYFTRSATVLKSMAGMVREGGGQLDAAWNAEVQRAWNKMLLDGLPLVGMGALGTGLVLVVTRGTLNRMDRLGGAMRRLAEGVSIGTQTGPRIGVRPFRWTGRAI